MKATHALRAALRAPAVIQLIGMALIFPLTVACGGEEQPSAEPFATWSRHERVVGDGSIFAVAEGGPGFVGGGHVGRNTAFWTSPDGASWTKAEVEPQAGAIVHVVAGGPGFIAISVDLRGPQALWTTWTSTDGLNWTMAPNRPEFGEVLTGIVTDGEVFVASAARGLWRSEDGLTWELAAVTGGDLLVNAVAVGGPGFVAVGTADIDRALDRGVVWLSADGTTWERLPHPAFAQAQLQAIAAGEDGLVAVGSRGLADGEPAVWRSADGLSWTTAEVSAPVWRAGMTDVARTPSGWIGFGADALLVDDRVSVRVAIWTSPDGATWSQAADEVLHPGGRQWPESLTRPTTLLAAADRVLLVAAASDGSTTIWISPPVESGSDPP